jgi:hypothetical protein
MYGTTVAPFENDLWHNLFLVLILTIWLLCANKANAQAKPIVSPGHLRHFNSSRHNNREPRRHAINQIPYVNLEI